MAKQVRRGKVGRKEERETQIGYNHDEQVEREGKESQLEDKHDEADREEEGGLNSMIKHEKVGEEGGRRDSARVSSMKK